MQNYFLESGIQSIIDQVTPEIPHSSFVTDLAIIMILASVTTLAFFKMRQPLIIGYLFAGMLIGPLSPIWTWLLPGAKTLWDLNRRGCCLISDC